MTGLMRILTRLQMKHKLFAKGLPPPLMVKGQFLFVKILYKFSED